MGDVLRWSEDIQTTFASWCILTHHQKGATLRYINEVNSRRNSTRVVTILTSLSLSKWCRRCNCNWYTISLFNTSSKLVRIIILVFWVLSPSVSKHIFSLVSYTHSCAQNVSRRDEHLEGPILQEISYTSRSDRKILVLTHRSCNFMLYCNLNWCGTLECTLKS